MILDGEAGIVAIVQFQFALRRLGRLLENLEAVARFLSANFVAVADQIAILLLYHEYHAGCLETGASPFPYLLAFGIPAFWRTVLSIGAKGAPVLAFVGAEDAATG